MKSFYFLIFFIGFTAFSQVGIGTREPNVHTKLDIRSPNKGILIPTIAIDSTTDISLFDLRLGAIPESLLIYNIQKTGDVVEGYYYWYKKKWNKLAVMEDIKDITPEGKDIGSATEDLDIKGGEGAVFQPVNISINAKAVTEAKLADNAVTNEKIKDKTVTNGKIVPGKANQILTTDAEGESVVWSNAATTIGKNMNSDHFDIDGREGAVLKEVTLKIKGNVIEEAMIKNKAVTSDKIKPGKANEILITDAEGESVVWAAQVTLPEPKDLESPTKDFDIKGREGAVLQKVSISINDKAIIEAKLADKAVTTEKVKDQAVIPAKIKPGEANQILTTDAEGESVEWAYPAAAEGSVLESPKDLDIKGGERAVLQPVSISVNAKAITEAKLADSAVTEAKLVDKAVTTEKIQDQSVTPIKIKKGKANQILTTDEKGTVKWAEPENIIVTNELVIEGEDKNTIKSAVNGVEASTSIIYEVENTLAVPTTEGSLLTTSVNGVKANVFIPEPWHTGEDIKASSNEQDIYQMGKVGIGTKKPGALLDVAGDALINGIPVGTGSGKSSNITIGKGAAIKNKEGISNIAIGNNVFASATKGSYNIAIGSNALTASATANFNMAVGMGALASNQAGDYNIHIGYFDNINIPRSLNNTIAIGFNAHIYRDNVIRLGNEKNTLFYCAVPLSVPYMAETSSIKDLSPGLDFIKKLRAVEYLQDNDTKTKHWGFDPIEIEKILKDVGYEKAGIVDNIEEGNGKKVYYIRNTDLIAPIVKAIQEIAAQNGKSAEENQLLFKKSNNLKRSNDQQEERLNVMEKKVQQLYNKLNPGGVKKLF